MKAKEKPTEKKTAVKKTAAKTTTVKKTVRSKKATATDEDIRKRAYEIFMERGGVGGNAHDDWAQAKKELLG